MLFRSNGRGNPWVNHIAALGTEKHPLLMVGAHEIAAASAETVGLIPSEKVMGGNPGKGGVLGLRCPENADILIGVADKGNGRRLLKDKRGRIRVRQEIFVVIYGKQIVENTFVRGRGGRPGRTFYVGFKFL